MKTRDVEIYSFRQATINALDMSEKYHKNYAVVRELNGYAVISARYARINKDKLDIQFTTDIEIK